VRRRLAAATACRSSSPVRRQAGGCYTCRGRREESETLEPRGELRLGLTLAWRGGRAVVGLLAGLSCAGQGGLHCRPQVRQPVDGDGCEFAEGG